MPLRWLAGRSCDPVVSLLCPLCVPLGNCYSPYRTFPCKVPRSFASSHLFLFSNVEGPGKTYPDAVAYPDPEDNSPSPPLRRTRLNNVIPSPLAGWARLPPKTNRLPDSSRLWQKGRLLAESTTLGKSVDCRAR